ncbi:MAG: two-component sensor histidine kinase [Rhizobacter sp.]|nr:two-component sensor histidine kinase [Rhizobacter sp.]
MKLLKTSSLRMRLLVALMLAILGFWATWFGCQAVLMANQQTNRWDASMQAVGQQILLSIPKAPLAGSSDAAYHLPQQIHQQPELLSYQVWLANGRSVLRSTGSPVTPWVPLRFDKAEDFHAVTEQGVEWRVYTLTDASGQLQVQIGKSQPQLLSLLRLWLGTSVGTVLLLMALLGGVTWTIICWSLSPVEAVREAILERAPLDLKPLPAHELPGEVKPLVESFNALLLRLETALQGERRFLADAAHELRTPLAALMAQAQLVKSARTLEESRASLAPLIAGIERTARLTEQLLDMARLDAVESPAARPPVGLHEIVSLVVRDYDGTARAATQRLQLRAEPCHAHVDVDSVGVLLRNLLDNALRYAGPGARVEVVCREQEVQGRRHVVLSVRDDGPGVPEDEHGRIFDRFYRVPGSPGRGSGIGLSLVSRIANLHGAALETGSGLDGRGFGVTLRFGAAANDATAQSPSRPQAQPLRAYNRPVTGE